MSKLSFFSTHTGANGGGCGAIAAGLVDIGGIEIEPYPAQLYRQNFGPHIREESILDTAIGILPDFDFLWSSPSCQSFSSSKTDGKELQLDIDIAQKIAEIIRKKRPRYFALENVRKYRKSESFAAIVKAIDDEGYNFDYAVHNAVDFGGPQDRDRLILRASRELLRGLTPTHSCKKTLLTESWNGWLSAIEDLIPKLKTTHVTVNQQKAIAAYKNLQYPFIIERVGYGHGRLPNIRLAHEPVWTIRASLGCDDKGSWRSPITAVFSPDTAYALDFLCLARFQGFPANYIWGDRAGLNAYAIGNAVHVGFAQRVIESIIGGQK